MPNKAKDEGDRQPVRLLLTTEAANILPQLAGSPRKQGEYVSQLILEAAKEAEAERIAELEAELARLKGQGDHEQGKEERL